MVRGNVFRDRVFREHVFRDRSLRNVSVRDWGLRDTALRDIALDLGTTKVAVTSRRGGLLASGPAAVAIETETGEVVAFGHAAAAMAGRTPESLTVTFPIRGGVIVDFEAAASLIRAYLRSAGVRRLHFPRVIACVPSATTAVERRAAVEAIYRAGAAEVRLLGHALAGALGAGVELDQPAGTVVVDIGGGTTEVAVVSLGGVVVIRSARIGGIDLDAAIADYLRNRRGVIVSAETAEQIKFDLANVEPQTSTSAAEKGQLIRARKVSSGEVVELEITSADVGDGIYGVVRAIADLVAECISCAPPEIANDLIDSGIYLLGGGARLQGLDRLLRQRTKLLVTVVPEPTMAAASGAERCLGLCDELADLFLD